jgi:hypothetical protein
MHKLALIITLSLITSTCFSQTDTFDVFTYRPPEFFSKQVLANSIVFSRTEKGNACTITLYKSKVFTGGDSLNFMRQWNNDIIKRYRGITRKPKLYTGAIVNEWHSTLGIGKCTINKKSNIIMLNSNTYQGKTFSVVYSFNDPIFQPVIEKFSENLKPLIDQTP